MSSKKASDEIGEIHVKRWDRQIEVLDQVSNNFNANNHSLFLEMFSPLKDDLNVSQP